MKKLFFLLFLSGCMIGPNYQAPKLCLPSEYQEMQGKSEPIDLATWWKQFHDPTLSSLIDEALACNFDFRIALHKVEEVRGLYRIDRSILYPQIQGNFTALKARRSETLGSAIIETAGTPATIEATDFSGPLIQWFYQTGLDASWEIDLWGKNRRLAEAAYSDLEASQENALNVQITLISDVASTYIDVRSLQQRIRAKREQIHRQRELLIIAYSRYEAGLVSYRDVSLAKGELDTQESTLPPLERALQTTLHGLAVLLGRFPEGFSLEEGMIPKAMGRIPPDLPSQLLCQRPDIRQADRELSAATSRIGVAWGQLLPSFSLVGSFGTQTNMADQIFSWPSRFWTIGPDMIWNLFTGGRLLAQIKVANERQKQAILQYEKVVSEALQDVEDRLVGYFQEQKRLTSLEEQFAADSLTRDLGLEQYTAGLISLDDVMRSENRLFITQQSMIESQAVLMLQLVGLYKALGGGWQCSN